MKKPEKEEFEFDLTWEDIPNFRRTRRTIEEVIAALVEERNILRARIEIELDHDVA